MVVRAGDSPEIAELELWLECRAFATYLLTMRFERPDDDVTNDPLEGREVVVTVYFPALAAKALDPAAYGRFLSDSLFASEAVRQGFHACRTEARSNGWLIRLRLAIGASAPELHELRWETLRDPEHPDSPLLTDQSLLFSRFLHSGNDRRIRPGSKRGTRRALVAVANPTGLPPTMAAIDVAAEIARARHSLEPLGFQVEILARGEDGSSLVTLDALAERLGNGTDVLYLVAHGSRKMPSREPWVALENQEGSLKPTTASELAGRLRQVTELPLLAMLVTCQSAGGSGQAPSPRPADGQPAPNDAPAGVAGTGEALAALAPRLVEAGVPAVIGMQGDLSMRTASRLLPAFFAELGACNGMIDRAMTAARALVQAEPDSWMPVLYLRLKSACLWYEPGLQAAGAAAAPWASLIRNVRRGNCVAILGPELSERLLGSRREIARRWAEEHAVPLVLQDRDDLAQVAQYLAVVEGASFPANTLVDHIHNELRRRYANADPRLLRGDISKLIESAGARLRASDPLDPHRILAGLPLKVYITASPGSMLTDALREAGRDPQLVVAPWHNRVEQEPLPDEYEPSEQQPLVYHALGRFEDPQSLVITEDDFFEYLIGITARRFDIPEPINSATAQSALLFLGFSPEDWTFRVLFSTIMSQEGRAALNGFDHVAVQVSPDERRPDNPRGLRHYLETYFRNRVFQGRFSVYWGNADDFLGELLDRSPELRERVLGLPTPDEPVTPMAQDTADGTPIPAVPFGVSATGVPAGSGV
jgi:hypothetical protein